MFRFLITDDDDVTHAFLRHVLLGLGDVAHAFSGTQAVESCQQALESGAPFTCLLMDVLMPGMNGLEAVRRIRTLYAEAGVPAPLVLIMSCLSYQECLAGGLVPAHADRYIAKPFDRRTVLAALAELGIGQPPPPETGEDSW
jgi:two-component system, chemotaxis family, chemotaxis protein CheY